jgi:thiosulfate dehydrogenase [quinone] large subunit
MNQKQTYTNPQTFWLVILRLLIGWHFLYEGLSKFFIPGWSAKPYLMDSQGFLSGLFNSIADSPALLSIANAVNMYGLTLVGLGLILGCFARVASIGGIIFLALFYLSHPPYVGAASIMPTEGTYLWIDKNLVEMGALLVLIYFPTSHIIGFDRFIRRLFKRNK